MGRLILDEGDRVRDRMSRKTHTQRRERKEAMKWERKKGEAHGVSLLTKIARWRTTRCVPLVIIIIIVWTFFCFSVFLRNGFRRCCVWLHVPCSNTVFVRTQLRTFIFDVLNEFVWVQYATRTLTTTTTTTTMIINTRNQRTASCKKKKKKKEKRKNEKPKDILWKEQNRVRPSSCALLFIFDFIVLYYGCCMRSIL